MAAAPEGRNKSKGEINMKPAVCTYCGKEIDPSQLTPFHDHMLCPDCLEEHTVLCDCCGDRIWLDDNEGDQDLYLCAHCRERYYLRCTRCGRLIHEERAYYDGDDDDEPFCDSCYHSSERINGIRNYHYKPVPYFYGEGPRYFGVELEVDGAGEDKENARRVLSVANRIADHLYIKHDGSLDEGFELVTHPMSLYYHCNEMPWQAVLNTVIDMGYRSHQTGTCGLHCHVSRNAFGETEAEQDAVIARILFFVEKHWMELLKFSRRTPRQLERWASRYGYKEQPKDILDHAKKGGIGRYACVNLNNEHTIEFRLFRGTLKLNTLIATLQIVDRICDVAIFLSDDEIKELSWSSFVSGCIQPELIQYLKERRLYVNDLVESEVEL